MSIHAQAGRHQEAVDAYTESLALEGVSAEFQSKLFCNRAAALSSLKQWKQVVWSWPFRMCVVRFIICLVRTFHDFPMFAEFPIACPG